MISLSARARLRAAQRNQRMNLDSAVEDLSFHGRALQRRERIGRNGLWKLFRAGNNPKRRAVRLNIPGVGGAGGAAEPFGWIAAVRFLPLAMT